MEVNEMYTCAGICMQVNLGYTVMIGKHYTYNRQWI